MYLKDPTTNKPSVSLTFLVSSFLLVVGFSIASMFDYGNAPEPLMDLFYACAALYFGRRVNIGAKSFSTSNEKEEPRD